MAGGQEFLDPLLAAFGALLHEGIAELLDPLEAVLASLAFVLVQRHARPSPRLRII